MHSFCGHTVFADISHGTTHHLHPDLRQRGDKTVYVYEPDAEPESFGDNDEEYSSSEEMHPSILTYLKEYADDLEARLRVGTGERKLPVTLAVSALLNPMFGLTPLIVGAGLMTLSQYDEARKSLVQMMQDYFDAKAQSSADLVNVTDSGSEDSRDGIIPNAVNASYMQANSELLAFEKLKKVKYHPDFDASSVVAEVYSLRTDAEGNEVERTIRMGTKVSKRGSDLPSKKNLADYIDRNGRFDVLSFFGDHKRQFPTLFIIAQRMASRRVVEVGCERFFSISGYLSDSRRTQLGVRTYEQLAMLAPNINSVYVDPEMAAKEYLSRCKSGMWKKKFAEDFLKSWNLERILEAETFQRPTPDELSMQDLMKEVVLNDDVIELDD